MFEETANGFDVLEADAADALAPNDEAEPNGSTPPKGSLAFAATRKVDYGTRSSLTLFLRGKLVVGDLKGSFSLKGSAFCENRRRKHTRLGTIHTLNGSEPLKGSDLLVKGSKEQVEVNKAS